MTDKKQIILTSDIEPDKWLQKRSIKKISRFTVTILFYEFCITYFKYIFIYSFTRGPLTILYFCIKKKARIKISY